MTGIVVDRLFRVGRIRLARIVNWSVFAVVLAGSIVHLWTSLREAMA